jgi:hypothetical protein
VDQETEERKFWLGLEFRVCRELRKLPDYRYLWCDGFLPESYELDGSPRAITGDVWIGTGPRRQEKWSFTLILPSFASSPSGMAWSALVPPEELTGWLAVDTQKRELNLDLRRLAPEPRQTA